MNDSTRGHSVTVENGNVDGPEGLPCQWEEPDTEISADAWRTGYVVLQIGGEAVVLTERAAHALGSQLQNAAGKSLVDWYTVRKQQRAVRQSDCEAL